MNDVTTPATEILQDKSGVLLQNLQNSLNEAREELNASVASEAFDDDRQKLVVVFDDAQRILDTARIHKQRHF